MEKEEHEVYGGEIPDKGKMEGDADVDMSATDDDAVSKVLAIGITPPFVQLLQNCIFLLEQFTVRVSAWDFKFGLGVVVGHKSCVFISAYPWYPWFTKSVAERLERPFQKWNGCNLDKVPYFQGEEKWRRLILDSKNAILVEFPAPACWKKLDLGK